MSRPSDEDTRLTALTAHESALAHQTRKPRGSMIALTAQAMADTRQPIQLMRGPKGDFWVAGLVLQMPAGAFRGSGVMLPGGSPMRTAYDNMLPALAVRLVIPRENLTEEGWRLVSESEAAFAQNEHDRWTLGGWHPYPGFDGAQLRLWRSCDQPQEAVQAMQLRTAALVFGNASGQVVFTFSPDAGPCNAFLLNPLPDEDLAGLTSRACAEADEALRVWSADSRPPGGVTATAQA